MSNPEMNQQVVLSRRPQGVPLAEHFERRDVAVPAPGPGEFLVKCNYWSVDPAQRGWANSAPNYLPPVEIGAPMRSYAVGEIIESQHPDFAVGQIVSGLFGWQSHAISNGSDVSRIVTETDLPPSLALGILGLNGLTAYLGLTTGCLPTAGDTLVVSTAAGAVGSAVGQIANILGCRTVGITSSPEKMALCRDLYGFDDVISYRDGDVSTELAKVCPEGVDCYFDNTCGPISDAVMEHLNTGARITVCGTAALTDWSPIPLGPRVHRQLLVARARMQGFLINDHVERFPDALRTLSDWIRDGQLSYREDILHGADAAPDAIARLYRGENTGKLLIKLD